MKDTLTFKLTALSDWEYGVYLWTENAHYVLNKNRQLTRAWTIRKEQPKPVELTLDQIAEKFGVNVNQLKIKK
jgi:hypothetical protein